MKITLGTRYLVVHRNLFKQRRFIKFGPFLTFAIQLKNYYVESGLKRWL